MRGNLPSAARTGRPGARQKISLREDCRQTVKTVKGGCACRSLQGWVAGQGGEREGALRRLSRRWGGRVPRACSRRVARG